MTLLFISLSIGLLIGVATWNIYQVFTAVPDEDRSLLDQPPIGFRIVWPLIRLACHYFGFLVTQKYRMSTDLRLKHAGVQYSLSPEQFFFSKCLCAIAAALVVCWLLILVGVQSPGLAFSLGIGGFFYPELWLRETANRRKREVFRALPFYLDIITLSVEAGSNLTGGLTQAVHKSGDSPLRTEWSRVLRDIRAGKTRAQALRDMSNRAGSQPVTSVINSMIQAEASGSSLGSILRAQSDQLRTTRFMQAEKLAMEAPVKLLGPLVIFIFPTTFMVLGFVILSKAIQAGVITWGPLLWAYSWPG